MKRPRGKKKSIQILEQTNKGTEFKKKKKKSRVELDWQAAAGSIKSLCLLPEPGKTKTEVCSSQNHCNCN